MCYQLSDLVFDSGELCLVVVTARNDFDVVRTEVLPVSIFEADHLRSSVYGPAKLLFGDEVVGQAPLATYASVMVLVLCRICITIFRWAASCHMSLLGIGLLPSR